MARSCLFCLLPLNECICDDEPGSLPLPETEEEMAADPGPSFTVERGRHYETGPLSAPGPLRRMLPCSLLPIGDDASRYFESE